MELPLTVITVVGILYSERLPAYVDQIQSFVFVGEPNSSEREQAIECATEMVQGYTNELEYLDIDEMFRTGSMASESACAEYTEGNVSIHWGQEA